MRQEEPFAFRDPTQNGLRILAKFEHRNRFHYNMKFKFKLTFWQTQHYSAEMRDCALHLAMRGATEGARMAGGVANGRTRPAKVAVHR